MEVLPYFDLKGFIEKEIAELPDSIFVSKGARINWKEDIKTTKLSKEQIAEELEVFVKADINKPSLATAYDTEVVKRFLIHELKPDEKGELKKMTVTYGNDEVTAVELMIKKESTFYNSTTIAKLYMAANTFNIDHYSIETTQKILFMDPNNVKVTGSLRYQ